MKYLNIGFPGKFRNWACVIFFILPKATAWEQQHNPRSGGLAAELEQQCSAQSDILCPLVQRAIRTHRHHWSPVCPEDVLFVHLKALLASSTRGHTVRNQNQVDCLKFLSWAPKPPSLCVHFTFTVIYGCTLFIILYVNQCIHITEIKL